MKIGAFIIHLARAESRRSHVELLQRALPMPTAIIDAVDGAHLSNVDKAAVYSPRLHRPRYPFSLTPGEIGCFLSHRRVWQSLLDGDLDAALIIEDDVDVDQSRLPEALSLATEVMTLGDYVRLPWRTHSDMGKTLAARGGYEITRPSHIGLGTLGQVVGREAARRLVKGSAVFDRPVDVFLQARWLHGVRVMALRPPLIDHRVEGLGETTIHPRNRPLADKLVREVRRAWYRSAVHIFDAGYELKS